MGKVRAFEFTFTGNKTVFFPGQWISGNCRLILNDSLKIKSFTIQFMGEIGYRTKKNGPVRKREIVTPVQTQPIYAASTISLGEHTHQFRFQIPPEMLPTSFEGDFGFIRYFLQGVIERPWKENITSRKVLTVWEYIDCNNPLLSAPQIGQSEKLVQGGCLSSSQRNFITLQLDRRGYCPGENIISSVKVEDFPPGIHFKLFLTMVSTFSEAANKPPQTKREILQSVGVGTSPRGATSHRFNNVSLQIPSIPPTIRWRGSSGIGISVYYLVELKMVKKRGNKVRSFWHVNVPVTMGTIPLSPNNANQSHEPLTATLSNANSQPTAEPPSYFESSPSAPPLPDDLPEMPPSYEECVLGSTSLEPSAPDNLYGDSSYTPVYTMARGARMDYSFAES